MQVVLRRTCGSEFSLPHFSLSLSSLSLVAVDVFYIYSTIQSSTCCPRVREALNMQGTVFTLARLKIVPSYHQELV